MQDFGDCEIVIIDDCSTDGTEEFVTSIDDSRIRYFRNETNVGSKLGDRAHIHRFVYELMRGRYFVYVCDDDYWLTTDLLGRQVRAMQENSNVAMVIGGQLSYVLTMPDEPPHLDLNNIDMLFDMETLTPRNPHIQFPKQMFPKTFMTSDEFIADFASNPAGKNLIVGATLFSRDHFFAAGAMASPDRGSKWQAGYEFFFGPGCFGNVIYFDEPAIVTEIRPTNASFQRTQVEHYLDAIVSVECAFEGPLASPVLWSRRKFIAAVKRRAIHELSRAFLGNTLAINRFGQLSLCSEENIRHPVRFLHVLPTFLRNGMIPHPKDVRYMVATELKPETIDKVRRFRDRYR